MRRMCISVDCLCPAGRRAPPDRSIAAARNGEREQGREYCARAPDGPVENDPAAGAQNDPAQRARNGPPQKVSGYRPCRDRRRAPAAHYDRRSGINPPSPTLCGADRCISLSAPLLGTPPSGWSRATIWSRPWFRFAPAHLRRAEGRAISRNDQPCPSLRPQRSCRSPGPWADERCSTQLP